jgi:hypothetical protein
MTKTKKPTPANIEAVLQRAMEVWDEPLPDLDIDRSILDVDMSTLPSIPPPARPPIELGYGKTQKISVRIRTETLAAVKRRALELGIPYQTLLNRQLREANTDHLLV